jgi:hypothetical protein
LGKKVAESQNFGKELTRYFMAGIVRIIIPKNKESAPPIPRKRRFGLEWAGASHGQQGGKAMITDIEEFIKSFHGQRRRTQWVVDVVPPEKAHWRPWPGELSPAEIICRIAAGHLMYAGAIAYGIWEVDDYEIAASAWDQALRYFHDKTEEALDLLRPLPNSILKEKCSRPDDNIPTATWRFLLAMLEHEIHHRSQLNTYLMLMNVRQPNLGGITIETVRAAASGTDISSNSDEE